MWIFKNSKDPVDSLSSQLLSGLLLI